MTGLAINPLLPSLDLPGANWADRYQITSSKPYLTALDAARVALGSKPPCWIGAMMRLRNSLGGLLGLRPAKPSLDQHRIGAFPIVSEAPHKVILGFDDWHLDFRIVVETADAGARTNVAVSTLVNRKNWFGRAYIFLITPFHILIVKRLLANLEA